MNSLIIIQFEVSILLLLAFHGHTSEINEYNY